MRTVRGRSCVGSALCIVAFWPVMLRPFAKQVFVGDSGYPLVVGERGTWVRQRPSTLAKLRMLSAEARGAQRHRERQRSACRAALLTYGKGLTPFLTDMIIDYLPGARHVFGMIELVSPSDTMARFRERVTMTSGGRLHRCLCVQPLPLLFANPSQSPSPIMTRLDLLSSPEGVFLGL